MKRIVLLLLLACLLLLTTTACGGQVGEAPTQANNVSMAVPEQENTTVSSLAQPTKPEPEDEKNGDATEVLIADISKQILYAGLDGDSKWHYVEKSPEDSSLFDVGSFTFYGDVFGYMSGRLASEIFVDEKGTYQITENGNLHLELIVNNNLYSCDYAVEVDDESLILTQISDSGLHYLHKKGHVLSLERGLLPENSTTYFDDKSENGTNISKIDTERLIQIVRNICATEFNATPSNGFQVKSPEYEGNECIILTYMPGFSGPTLFLSFTLNLDDNPETIVADWWGEKYEFRLSDYDYSPEEATPVQSSIYPASLISEWYHEIEFEYYDQLEEEGFGDAACAYWLNGDLVKVDVFVVTDVMNVNTSGYTSTYYYHGATPYLAHLDGYGNQEYLDVIICFWNGEILSWTGKDGIEHDGSNAEYEIFYSKALEEYQNVMKAHGSGGIGIKTYTRGVFHTGLGCSFTLPNGFVKQEAARSLTGCSYSYSFYNANLDMSIEYYEINTENYSKSGTDWMNDDYNYYHAGYAAGDDSITYFPRGDNWFVISGYSQDRTEVFYRRVYGDDEFYYYYLITYPAANKKTCDQMVGDFANSFKM